MKTEGMSELVYLKNWTFRAKNAFVILGQPLRIFSSKIVYKLKFCELTCYFMKMNNVGKATFGNPMLTARSLRRAYRRGQTLVEYALILAVISIVAIGVMINMGQQVKGVYSMISSTISSAQASH
jgi:Flp pilus assembly pilin Flp